MEITTAEVLLASAGLLLVSLPYLIHIYQGSALRFMNKIQKTH